MLDKITRKKKGVLIEIFITVYSPLLFFKKYYYVAVTGTDL